MFDKHHETHAVSLLDSFSVSNPSRTGKLKIDIVILFEHFCAELVDTGGLLPTAKGKKIRLSGGKLKKIDGPFVETREVVGGYALVEAKSYDEALDLATKFMDLHRIHWPAFEGECEIRPLEGTEPK